ncbi:hypothetical protein [Blastomonas sp. SL216]|uniref:hypothetical protein n=1 Tax=Blastomonas sp. SL216 TaxID=2995169 RepID=UPI002376FC6C|nr:hypothetical protein OU999_04155 [Blastomonas sp. SL216]
MVTELRWRTGLIAWLLPLMIVACVLFGFAAVDPSLAQDMADTRRGGILKLTQDMTLAGVNVPLAVLALYLAWEVFRSAWRWADQVAIRATPQGSTLLRAVPWSDISDVCYAKRGLDHRIVFTLNDGARRTIRGIDNRNDAGPKFAAFARERIGHG